jgi:hypothetical protein
MKLMTIKELEKKMAELEELQAETENTHAKLKAQIAELKALREELPKPPHPRWMPMNDEHYWYINDVPLSATWNNDICDINWYEFGNVFKTKEAAKFAVERLKVLAEMREWAGKWHDQYTITINHFDLTLEVLNRGVLRANGEMRFATEEDAHNCVEAVGADRIKKYYFMIPEEEAHDE